VIWDLEKKCALCGHEAAMQSAGEVYTLAFSKYSDNILATGGDLTLRVWEVLVTDTSRKVVPTDCNLGQLKRVITSIEMCDDPEHMYCGTSTGDALLLNVNTSLLKEYGPQKDKYSQGITALKILPSGDFLVGTGNGTVAALKAKTYKQFKMATVEGAVTSLTVRGSGHQFFIGTSTAQIYLFQFKDFSQELMSSCHYDAITDICFPRRSSELFATSSRHDARIWHSTTGKELLRIKVANLFCNAIEITPDGKAIITGWDDGKIRAFYPETAKSIYTIHNAHSKGVTALAVTSNSKCIISGGGEGQARVWDVISGNNQKMKVALKEHKGAISCIKIRSDDKECVTASTDGTCIIWDLM
jgi:WD40 repeat protein